MGRNPRENLQELRPQVHERSAREAPAGRPLHRTQPKNRQIHHILPLHCKVNLIWNRYKTAPSPPGAENGPPSPKRHEPCRPPSSPPPRARRSERRHIYQWIERAPICNVPDAQALFCRRRHQPSRPPVAKIRPGRPAPLKQSGWLPKPYGVSDDELTTASHQGEKTSASRYKTRQSRTHNRPRHCGRN